MLALAASIVAQTDNSNKVKPNKLDFGQKYLFADK